MIIQFDVGKETFKETFKEAFKETFKKAFKETLKEAFQETLQEAFQETLQEALRLQELRSLVPLHGGDEGFCHEGDGDRALCSQVGFFLSVPYHIKMIKASLVVPKETIFFSFARTFSIFTGDWVNAVQWVGRVSN